MRKALEFPRIDEGKLDAVEALIAAIADKEPGTAGAELEDLAALTGKVHTDVEFAEYWSWTDLDTLARLTLTPEPPCIPDLSREELVELVEIIQHCSVTGREWAMRYYTALLRRSLSLPNVMDFVASGGSRFSPVLRLPSLSAILEYATSSEQSAEKKDSFLCKKAGIQNRVPSYLRTYNKKKPLAFTDFYTV